MKKCSKCKEVKKYTEYNKHPKGTYGLYPSCKDCRHDYYQENKGEFTKRGRKWQRLNPEKVNKEFAKRAKALKLATPKWLTKHDHAIIKAMKRKVTILNKITGIKWHLDHYIPIRCKIACGLHVPNNLQVITAEENLKKGNRFDG